MAENEWPDCVVVQVPGDDQKYSAGGLDGSGEDCFNPRDTEMLSVDGSDSQGWIDTDVYLDRIPTDDTASSTSESEDTQIWVPSAGSDLRSRGDESTYCGSVTASADVPHGILKRSVSELTPPDSPENSPRSLGNYSDLRSDNFTSVSANGFGRKKASQLSVVVKNNTVLHYDPTTGLAEAVTRSGRDVPNGDSGIGHDCEEASCSHMDKYGTDTTPMPSLQGQRGSISSVSSSLLLRDSLLTNLSGLYGMLLIVLGCVIPIAEIFCPKPHPFLFEGFYIYLFGASIAFLLYAYVYILHTRTFRLSRLAGRTRSLNTSTSEKVKKYRFEDESSGGTAYHTGSFYLRLGAVGFGIGSMIKSGLHFGEFFETDFFSPCNDILKGIEPLIHLTFTFIQLYFVFLNYKMCIQSYNTLARFGLMHMVATNLSVWFRNLVKETIREIEQHSDMLLKTTTLHSKPEPLQVSANMSSVQHPANASMSALNGTILQGTFEIDSRTCAERSLMRQVVEASAPYLYPCSIQYSLICAGILYAMWRNVGSRLINCNSDDDIHRAVKIRTQRMNVDCSNSSRGLFIGIFLLVAAVITMIVFFVLVATPVYADAAVKLEHVSEIVINVLSSLAVVVGFMQMRELRFISDHPVNLEQALLLISLTGEYMFGFLSIIAGGVQHELSNGLLIIVSSVLTMVEASLQTVFMLNGLRRSAWKAEQERRKPGREFVTFLLVCNIAMWGINTFEVQRSESNPVQMHFYGVLSWNIFTHIAVPLIIFFRFHSTVCLSNIWKHAWKRKTNT